jgi:hypothetical protein
VTYEIRPRAGAGPIVFGMPHERVQAVLGPPDERLVRSPYSEEVEWLYHSRGVFVGFGPDGRCVQITLLPESHAELAGIDILRVAAQTAWESLRRLDPSASVEYESLVSRQVCVSIYAPHIGEDPEEPASNVMVFGPGYLDP